MREKVIKSDWRDPLKKLLDEGCTDSDVMDFIEEYPQVSGKDIWNFVYEYDAPEECRGCKYIQKPGLYPCYKCSRRVNVKDYYEAR